MNAQKYFVCVLFIMLMSIQSGLTLRCWDCRSDIDPKCGDPFDNTTLPVTNCSVVVGDITYLPNAHPVCRKIIQKAAGEWIYIRSCAYLGEPGIPRLNNTSNNKILIESCDDKDGCNSSGFLSPDSLVLAMTWIFMSYRGYRTFKLVI